MLNNLGGFAYWDGRWDEAVELYRRAGECAERAGRPADAAFTDCNVGEILSDQGHLDEAEAHLRARAPGVERHGRAAGGRVRRALLGAPDRAPRRVCRGAGDARGGAAETSSLRHRRVRGARSGAGSPRPRRSAATRSGAGDRQPSSCEANDRQRPLLTRMGGIALARLGETDGRHARARALAARPRVSVAPSTTSRRRSMRWRRSTAPTRRLLRERDEILGAAEDQPAADAGADRTAA